jgi:hypothetical protein
MDKGVIWDLSKGYPAHVVTWHEMSIPKLGNIRVWIHSKGLVANKENSYGKNNRARVTFSFGSIEIQIQGETFTPISENEKRLRLELASCAPAQTIGSVKSSNFRFIPVGQLEIDHMQCIKACYDNDKFEVGNGIRLVKSDKTPTLVFKGGKIAQTKLESKFESTIKTKFRSTQPYAIAIAKLYSDLSRIGNQKVIKQISIETGLPSENIYTALRVARGQGWLTSNGVGKAGGTLSAEGLDAFKRLDGEQVLGELLRNSGGSK